MLLAALVDKSLVEAVPPTSEPSRYRMLETIRVYSAEPAGGGRRGRGVPRAQAGYLLGLAEAADPMLRAPAPRSAG